AGHVTGVQTCALPILYDQFEDRWLLSQFTTSGLDDPTKPFWNCVAVSTTGDPTGTYYRYAFETTSDGVFYFPDYPKYGVWRNSRSEERRVGYECRCWA